MVIRRCLSSLTSCFSVVLKDSTINMILKTLNISFLNVHMCPLSGIRLLGLKIHLSCFHFPCLVSVFLSARSLPTVKMNHYMGWGLMIQGSEWSWQHTGQTLLRSHDQQGPTQELNRTVNGTAVTCAVGSIGSGGAFLGLQKLLSVIIPPLFLQQQVQPQLKVSIPWLRHQILWPLLLFILEHFTFIFTIDYKIPEDEVRFLRSKEEVKMFSLNPSVIFQQLCQNVSYYVNGCEEDTETRWRWYPAMGKWGLSK